MDPTPTWTWTIMEYCPEGSYALTGSLSACITGVPGSVSLDLEPTPKSYDLQIGFGLGVLFMCLLIVAWYLYRSIKHDPS